jgi:PAS domain S-box-containing protein
MYKKSEVVFFKDGYLTTSIKDITSDKQNQKLLYKLAGQWAYVYNAFHEGIFLTDKKYRIRFANKAIRKIFRKKLNKVQDKHCWQIIYGNTKCKKNCPIIRAKKTKHRATTQLQVNDRFYQVTIDPIIDHKKKFAGAIHTFTDISEYKKVLNTLTESEEKYYSLIKNINIGIYRTNPEGQFIDINPTMFRMFGFRSKKQFVKQKAFDLYQNPRDRRRFIRKLRKLNFITGEELNLKKKNGAPIIVSVFAHAHKDKAGNLIWIDGIIEDITERKKLESKLLTSEARFRKIVENSRDVIMVTRPNGIIEYVSPISTKVLGYTPKDLVGKITRLYHKDDIPIAEKIISLALQGKSGSNVEYRIITKKRKIKWVRHSWAPIKEGKKLTRVVSIITDITENKQNEQAEQKKLTQIIRHQDALLKLAKIKARDYKTAIQKILEIDSKALNVERVGFWLISTDESELHCQDLYLKSKNIHEKGIILYTKKYPYYLNALKKGRIIAVSDVYNNIATFEFDKDYFKPNKIVSMMDVPMWVHGKLIGIVCHEHIGVMRKWTTDEQGFATSVADTISATLESYQRQITQKLLKESEAKYHGLVQNVNIGVFRTTPDGKFIEANSSMARIFGYNSIQQLIKIPVTNLYKYPHDRDNFINIMRKQEQVNNYQVQQKKKDRSTIITSITARAHRNQNGKIDWFDGVVEDITERKLAEKALRESEERYRTLFESANDGICIMSPEGKIISANKQLLEMAGMKKVDIGAHINEYKVFTPESLALIEKNLKARLAGEKIKPYELVFYPRKGEPKNIEVTASVLRDGQQKVIGEVVFIRDITERKQAELSIIKSKELAESANQAKTAFLQNISHELRSPLTSIIGYTSLLLDTAQSNENQEMLKTIESSGNYLLKTVNNLLDLSRIESGRITFEHKETEIIDVFNKIYQRFLPIAKNKNINFKLTIYKNVPEYVITDSAKIEQIITNLLDNSFKFTAQGQIELRVQLKRPFLEFFVQDTGVGISQNRINEIYRQFFNGEHHLDTHYSGVGLGLSIIKRLTDLLKGKISLGSKLGQGTKFTIWIPVQSVKQPKRPSN